MTDSAQSVPRWRRRCIEKQQQQREAIPGAWRLKELPDSSVIDVRDIPRTCGILTETEIEITELDDVEVLLRYLREGIWSAVQVTTAYLKRALIAHQLVSSS
jgi:amidase